MNISQSEEQHLEAMAKAIREQNEMRPEISLGSNKQGVCKMFLHSTCNNPNCVFLHDTSRVQVCQNYLNNSCKYGNMCDFSHQASGVNLGRICPEIKRDGYCPNPDCKNKHILNVCLEYEKGFCVTGGMCKFAHVKRELCKNYMYGFCPKGPNCEQAHPKLLIEWDADIFNMIDPRIRIIKCNKCNILGHKANNCAKRKTVEITSVCPKCNTWHWKDNPCVEMEEEPKVL